MANWLVDTSRLQFNAKAQRRKEILYPAAEGDPVDPVFFLCVSVVNVFMPNNDNEDLSEKQFSLSPVNFFQICSSCHYLPPANKFPAFGSLNRKYLLPDTSTLCGEDYFADVTLGWNHEGIEALVYVKEPFRQVSFPDVSRGDSVELFFDTRDVKTSGFNTRFCHHFFFLPEAVEGHQAGEITRFRTEDTHELCNANDLKVLADLKSSSYLLHIFIPSQCLYGYDPDQFNRMGFTYRINRAHGSSQYFSVTSDEYQLEQQPSLWSSLKLIK